MPSMVDGAMACLRMTVRPYPRFGIYPPVTLDAELGREEQVPISGIRGVFLQPGRQGCRPAVYRNLFAADPGSGYPARPRVRVRSPSSARFRVCCSRAFSGNKAEKSDARIVKTSRPSFLSGLGLASGPSGGHALTSCDRRGTMGFIFHHSKRRSAFPDSSRQIRLESDSIYRHMLFTFPAFSAP